MFKEKYPDAKKEWEDDSVDFLISCEKTSVEKFIVNTHSFKRVNHEETAFFEYIPLLCLNCESVHNSANDINLREIGGRIFNKKTLESSSITPKFYSENFEPVRKYDTKDLPSEINEKLIATEYDLNNLVVFDDSDDDDIMQDELKRHGNSINSLYVTNKLVMAPRLGERKCYIYCALKTDVDQFLKEKKKTFEECIHLGMGFQTHSFSWRGETIWQLFGASHWRGNLFSAQKSAAQ
jgi:hypothetical protein